EDGIRDPLVTGVQTCALPIFLIALVAAAWWLCGHDRPATAGVVLAVATFLKPQALLLLPVALMFSGRIRAVAGWAAGCGALGVRSEERRVGKECGGQGKCDES